jgi:hypothetical protein
MGRGETAGARRGPCSLPTIYKIHINSDRGAVAFQQASGQNDGAGVRDGGRGVRDGEGVRVHVLQYPTVPGIEGARGGGPLAAGAP